MGNSTTHLKEVCQKNEPPASEPESHIMCAPVKNLIDPRSPTIQFDRTPIEVEGLPIKTRSRITSAHLLESPGPIARGSYFNANVIAKSSEEAEATRKLRRLRFLSDDPRSPTAGIVRTPIQVESTPEVVYHKINQEVLSPTDSLVTATSLEDLVSPSDNSPLSSDNEPTASLSHQRLSSTVFAHTPIQLEGLSNSPNHETIATFVTCQSDCNMEEPKDVTTNMLQNLKSVAESIVPANLNKTNGDNLIRKLFGTPDSKECLVQAHFKTRTPLKIVSANGISPQKILRVKHAHGINQEIGLLSGIENTPPDTFNRYDPLTKKKQLTKCSKSMDWDQGSTTII